jgi:hypothetical protein
MLEYTHTHTYLHMPIQNKIGERTDQFADVVGVPFLAWAIALIVFLRYRVQVCALSMNLCMCVFVFVCACV